MYAGKAFLRLRLPKLAEVPTRLCELAYCSLEYESEFLLQGSGCQQALSEKVSLGNNSPPGLLRPGPQYLGKNTRNVRVCSPHR